MNQSPVDIISGRQSIPEFILKVYEMLEKPEYNEIISWNSNNSEIVIKDITKMESLVLPNFFRHNKLRSFVRQLNMYRFRKVSNSQKNQHLHFKHDHFKRGNIQALLFIKRKKRNADDSNESDTGEQAQAETLERYKAFVRNNVELIQKDLASLIRCNPHIAPGFRRSLQISNLLTGKDLDYRLDILLDQFIEPCPEWTRLLKTAKEFEPPLSYDSIHAQSSAEYGQSLDHTT